MFFQKCLKLSQSLISICGNISICVEESNHIKDHKPVRSDFLSFCINCPWIWNIAQKEAQKQNISTQYTRLGRKTCYEILINTFLRPDEVHFDIKFFHENKTTPSSLFYFFISIFEKIPCTDKFPSFLVCWKD